MQKKDGAPKDSRPVEYARESWNQPKIQEGICRLEPSFALSRPNESWRDILPLALHALNGIDEVDTLSILNGHVLEKSRSSMAEKSLLRAFVAIIYMCHQ